MQLLIILLLGFLQFSAGFGVLCLLKIYLNTAFCISLSVLIGIAVFSVIPFLLQLAYIPLTAFTIFSFLIATCVLLNFNSKKEIIRLFNELKNYRPQLKPYEIPSLLLIGFMVFVSAWRCYYYPPTPRDLTSGAEVIAEYTAHEKTMVNSVFTADLSTTNNQFKPPFITCLQIIYKYAGFPFGQVWLSSVSIFFLVFLYHALSIRLHKIITGLLLVMFIAIPEMYAYSFMVLFDYSNTVFFFLSLYFLFEFFNNRQTNFITLSGILMAIATYIRSETLILAGFISIAIFFHYRFRSIFLKTVIKEGSYFLLPSLFVYLLSITVYINWYLPSAYNVSTLLNQDLLNPAAFYRRISDMTEHYLLSKNAVNYYGYFIFIFLIVFCINAFYKNAWNKNSLNWLFAVFVIFIGLPFIGYIFPLYDLDNSTKRGLFKIFPLMLLFMANSKFLISLSDRIKKWERVQ